MIAGWTEERVEKLKSLWKAGASASTIAENLGGGISRNAVIGKIHLLNLAERECGYGSGVKISAATGHVLNGKQIAARDRRYRAGKAKKPRQERFVPVEDGAEVSFVPIAPTPIREPIAAPESLNLSIVELTVDTCRWPLGDPISEDFRFCGAKTIMPEKPYCLFHSRLAYVPAKKRRTPEQEEAMHLRLALARRAKGMAR